AQRTSAPSVLRVSISTAVWIVMWSEPAMRAPARGRAPAYSLRMAISAGISPSAMAISFRPHSASERLATRKSGVGVGLGVMVVLMARLLFGGCGAGPEERRRPHRSCASAVDLAEPDRAQRPDATLLSGLDHTRRRTRNPPASWPCRARGIRRGTIVHREGDLACRCW